MNDLPSLQAYVGRHETRQDQSATEPLEALAATLNEPRSFAPGMSVPMLWHWIFFKPDAAQVDLREDGHPLTSGLLPIISLPRRMWAGSRLHIARPLLVGHRLSRTSAIEKIVEKQGKEGSLLFITLRHVLADEHGEAIIEEQDLVYRHAPAASARPSADEPMQEDVHGCDWQADIQPTTALLFRYSALTFNAHRIHYDLPYAQSIEHYPGLVVHGPLIATLLMLGAEQAWPGLSVASIEYRAKKPLFNTGTVSLKGRRTSQKAAKLWAHDKRGSTCATVNVEFSAT
jgi:3-methylfumaryl-CoA hydratase